MVNQAKMKRVMPKKVVEKKAPIGKIGKEPLILPNYSGVKKFSEDQAVFIKKSGDTMTGDLTIGGIDNERLTKIFVEDGNENKSLFFTDPDDGVGVVFGGYGADAVTVDANGDFNDWDGDLYFNDWSSGSIYLGGGGGTTWVRSGLTLTGNGNLIVDTDTLYVDAVNDRVGIGVFPSEVLDVGGNIKLSGDIIHGGVTDPWVEKAGDTMTGILYLDAVGTGLDVMHSATIGNHLTVGDDLTVGGDTTMTGALVIEDTLGVRSTNTTRVVNINGNVYFTRYSPTAPTAALAGLGAGNLGNGAYRYAVIFVTSEGDSGSHGNYSNTITVVDNGTDGKMALTNIPVGDKYVTSRKLYRTTAGGNIYVLYHLATIADNVTTTYTDNLADGSLDTTDGFYRKPDQSNARMYYGPNKIFEAGLYNTMTGISAGNALTTGNSNSFFGASAGQLATTGSSNTYIGYLAGYQNNGNSNVVVGYGALDAERTGNENTAIGTSALTTQNGGYKNTAIGRIAGAAITTGDNNICLGYKAGDNITTGSNNIIIGHDIDAPSATASNQLNIGDTITGDTSTGIIKVAGSISSATATITASSDTTDVSGINTLFIDITGDIVLGGLLGGVNGQVLNIVMLGNFVNHVTLEHAEGIADTQDFINHTAVDELISHGGAIYICNGTDWYDASHARHV